MASMSRLSIPVFILAIACGASSEAAPSAEAPSDGDSVASESVVGDEEPSSARIAEAAVGERFTAAIEELVALDRRAARTLLQERVDDCGDNCGPLVEPGWAAGPLTSADTDPANLVRIVTALQDAARGAAKRRHGPSAETFAALARELGGLTEGITREFGAGPIPARPVGRFTVLLLDVLANRVWMLERLEAPDPLGCTIGRALAANELRWLQQHVRHFSAQLQSALQRMNAAGDADAEDREALAEQAAGVAGLVAESEEPIRRISAALDAPTPESLAAIESDLEAIDRGLSPREGRPAKPSEWTRHALLVCGAR